MNSVAGHFDGSSLHGADATYAFVRRGRGFFVRTAGSDGTSADFEVRYTFGLYPLQQYLVSFPDGRMQALRAAWDARPRSQGGQHWFELYPGEHIDAHDPLYWTRLNQNWNFMCADCHSTSIARNYDADGDRFKTTWSEINVACEACHGPGSGHVAWASGSAGAARANEAKGLSIALNERSGVHWIANPVTGNPVRSAPLTSHREVETCAVCHARRGILGKQTAPTGRLMDTHDPALLTSGLYYADGQQEDEVYTYGSFLQSRMYAKGVTCSDCHDPHTGGTRAQGNALCDSCHTAALYDTPAHHLHASGSPGAQCVACHMPAKNYMVVDPRPDHSIRVPRPDLTAKFGVPNACDNCHAKKGASWAAAAISKAHGESHKGFQQFGEALEVGRSGAPGAANALATLASDEAVPIIARATAVRELQRYASSRVVLPTLREALVSPEPLLRAAALDALLAFPEQLRGVLALPLADDPVKAVRIKAGPVLASVSDAHFDPKQRAARERAFAFYVESQDDVAERPESHFNLGIVFAERGASTRAEQEFRWAMRLQPDFVPAYANLADLYRALGRENEVTATLTEGLKIVPRDAGLLHAMGLALVRQGRPEDALRLLKEASEGQPLNTRYAYVYGVALNSAGQGEEARAVLEKVLQRSPYDPATLAALASFARDAGRLTEARGYARRLVAVAPDSPEARQLLQSVADP